jgi:hypothetical protein
VRRARHEVLRQRERIDETFARIGLLNNDATEVQADFAKYLCVRVSGYLETSIAVLLTAYVGQQSSPAVARFIASEMARFQNAKRERILRLFGRFNEDWRRDLERYLVDERSDAIATIVANRHRIAHGEDSAITYVRVREHWKTICEVVDHIADLLDPAAAPGGDR